MSPRQRSLKNAVMLRPSVIRAGATALWNQNPPLFRPVRSGESFFRLYGSVPAQAR